MFQNTTATDLQGCSGDVQAMFRGCSAVLLNKVFLTYYIVSLWVPDFFRRKLGNLCSWSRYVGRGVGARPYILPRIKKSVFLDVKLWHMNLGLA